MFSAIRKITFAIALLLASVPSYAFTITFEDGLSYGLGQGPVGIPVYDFGGFVVSFSSNASYADTPDFSVSGRVTVARFDGHVPFTISFNQPASAVSVWALSGLGSVQSSMTAYGLAGDLIGADTFTGLPADSGGAHPYKALLSVSSPGIRSVVLNGQFWVDSSTGWYTTFDDLSVTPVPELPVTVLLLAGLLTIIGVSRRRRQLSGWN
jgi:hypothetical protein